MYTVKHAARLVGVSEATLRAWDRRHGIGPTARSQAGYRLYDDQAVDTLRTMKALVAQGWPLPDAASEACRRGPQLTQESDPHADELIAYAASFDARGLDALLDTRFTQVSFEKLADDWLLPSMRELGVAWAQGRVSVAGEHFVSHAVNRRLAASYDAAGESLHGHRVVLGLPPGCHHDLGLLCFATAARRAGLATRYLGADVPLDDWGPAVAAPGITAAVLAVPRASDIEKAVDTFAHLRGVDPALRLAVGGGHQDAMPEGVVRLGHGIASGVRNLITHLSHPTASSHVTPFEQP